MSRVLKYLKEAIFNSKVILTSRAWWAVVVDAFYAAFRRKKKRQVDLCEFVSSLVYRRASSRTARAPQRGETRLE